MGRLIYAGSPNDSYRLDDRLLAHLELAIAAKFRLGDSFAFTLEGDQVPAGSGYHVLWMHPSISLQFRYDGERRTIAINPTWVGDLVAAASSDAGMRIVPEAAGPGAGARRGPGAGGGRGAAAGGRGGGAGPGAGDAGAAGGPPSGSRPIFG